MLFFVVVFMKLYHSTVLLGTVLNVFIIVRKK